ncbi:hypothetical protein Xmau_03186 [Xenorhabdus mauleonii]|uniref:Uncharacterized protein n=1 Tax=Xenorhabdus mauleonii TaxID=351675 RepID=A0A1I3VGY2_9GAMM|nr:hypothetical protein [Xenorhabdus mauleonii]PHM39017.1 hypothetical protein Xmau_03186 [Xenorhabdus mauleonii]SFJ93477.1 hypothetical protein SAMN05421680_12050 [Xenorhabdus mauleonii]
MILYELDSTLKSNGDVIDINDSKGRLSSYFIWNKEDGNFLNFMKPRCQSQKNIKLDNLLSSDYLPANIGIPVFSKKAMKAFESTFIDDIKGFECIVNCEEGEYVYYMCFINVFLNLVDTENSEFRSLSNGRKILTKAIYKNCDELDFYIARDTNFKERLIVSQKFVDFCHSNELNINFLKVMQV